MSLSASCCAVCKGDAFATSVPAQAPAPVLRACTNCRWNAAALGAECLMAPGMRAEVGACGQHPVVGVAAAAVALLIVEPIFAKPVAALPPHPALRYQTT